MACLAAKPSVDGLEREMQGRAVVLRADIHSDPGSVVADRFGLRTVPSFVVLRPDGEVVQTVTGSGAPIPELRQAIRLAGQPAS